MLTNFPIVGKPYKPIKIKSFNAYKGLQFGGGGELPTIKKSFNPTEAEDPRFQQWYKYNTLEGQANIPYDDKQVYDYLSFYKNGDYRNPNYGIDKHFPDTYKRPNHPTFSNESIYSTPEKPGGKWGGNDGETFNPKGKFRYANGGNLFPGGGELPKVGPSILKNIMSILPATAPIVNGIDKVKQNIAENLNPWGYTHPIQRVVASAIGRKSQRRTESENEVKNGGVNAERIDLLQLLLNRPQKYNSILDSEYIPLNSVSHDTKYFKSPMTELYLTEELKNNPVKNEIDRFSKLQRESLSLGEYKTDYGKDEKGPYVSYYDKWDLNPIPESGFKWLDRAVDSVITGLPNILGLTTTPEIYGRVYLDQKTGKPLQKKYGGKIKLINL